MATPKKVKSEEPKTEVVSAPVVEETPVAAESPVEDKGSFETTAPVQFTVNGEVFVGTKFSFPLEVVEDRKSILVAAYGKDIIKE